MILRLDYDVVINTNELVYVKRNYSRITFFFKTTESLYVDYCNDDTTKLVFDKICDTMLQG